MKKNTVAFIFHPLDVPTTAMMLGIPKLIAKFISKDTFKWLLNKKKPFVVGKVKNIVSKKGAKIDLICVAVPFLPEQMVMMKENLVVDKIVEAVNFSAKKGASIAVLAGFTSIIGNQGLEVSKRVMIPVTTGNTYTAWVTIQSVLKAASLIGLDLSRSNCAIIGATGDVGSACVKQLLDHVQEIIISARNQSNLEDFVRNLPPSKTKVTICKDTSSAIKNAQIIITATSSLTTLINSAEVLSKAIICDVALPPNIARSIIKERKDIFVYEGGLSKIPSFNRILSSKMKIWWKKNAIYGCLSEGLILAMENRLESFTLGRGQINKDKLTLINQWADMHGFEMADYACGDKVYTHGFQKIDFN